VEVLVMLEFLRENQAAPQDEWGDYEMGIFEASQCLKILDPKRGDKELAKAVAVELARLQNKFRCPPMLGARRT
jgi:hypothetical protein